MADRDEDDLFQPKSMSFGEHLDELRSALMKAVLALLIWFCIGLIFAPKIVQLIQSPLEDALKKFYSQEAEEYLTTHLANVPAEMRNDKALQELVTKDGLVPQEVFFDPHDLLEKLRQRYPVALAGVALDRPAAGSAQPGQAGSVKADAPAQPSGAAQATSPVRPTLTKEQLISTFEWRPLSEDDRLKVESFNVQESFLIYIKAAFLFGAVASSPFVFYFLWNFVAAGLYPHEKRYVHLFLPFSVGLFLAGVALAFLFVFPPVLNFLFGITKSMNQGIRPRISEWLSFVLLMPLGFGVAFQLPLVMLFLERIRIFSVDIYQSKWRIAVLLMAVAAMLLSPGGDPYSMMLMFIPLVALYFGGIAFVPVLAIWQYFVEDVCQRICRGTLRISWR